MSEPMDVAQWAKNWEAMARQAQASMGGNAAQPAWFGGQAPSNPWAEALANAKPFVGGAQQSEAMEHLMAGAQGYLGMLQSLASAGAGQGIEGFQNPFANGFIPGMASPSVMNNPFAAAMRDFGNQGSRGFEQLMEQFSAAAGPMLDQAKASTQMPAFGHMREKQENLQKTAQVFIDYQEQSARYDRLMLKVSEQSFARFQLKLAEREEPGRQIDSARGLYDLWIDAAEEAYAEIALSEEFREIYAAVVDAQMRVRQQVQGEIEKLCTQLGMPTRSEINSIGERLQALRREFREEREGSEDQQQLRNEVAELRRELAALTAAPKSASKSPVRKSAAKPAKTATPSKTAKATKAAKPAKPAKPTKAARSAKAAQASKSETKIESATAPASDKSSSKTTRKPTAAHRDKRRKAAASKGTGAKQAPSANAGDFAASIARFARKSKSSKKRGSTRAAAKAVKRGGSK
ncbi:MAG TPA: poly(R)-hydroxyalkanoic acid synthase subunit PhaE [Dokdonella sp.]|uniref:poly(R)-hydroxyalkanoic acid synthase subunit PhaE n=1 Tax=Dokdonella sp. TaxID=2291710 RepID=UPI002D7FF5DF|nr:poly(R)-hydroxyalkanoic acid synthase subunit PhaE [Dokdonella sp.]HET9032012.1 poly(R)-hydroxyalkanoic acid synthase subunit PhaE [Dokdonella sp.]